MGRKSSAKKIVRELIKEKEVKEKKKLLKPRLSKKKLKETKKELKKEALKKTSKPAKKTKAKAKPKKKKKSQKITKGQMFGAVLTIIMLGILISVGFLLFQKVFRAQSVARLLPEQETILTIELNSNLDHHQLTKAFKLLENHQEYSQRILTAMVDKKFQVNFQDDIEPWLGREVGMALIESKSDKSLVNTVYFAEILSQPAAELFLQNLPAELSQYKYAFIKEILFFSENEAAIRELEEFQAGEGTSLNANQQYRKIANNLPINRMAFAYINFDKVSTELFQQFSFFDNDNAAIPVEMISPFLNLLDSEGMALIALDDKFAIQSFLNLNTKNTANQLMPITEKYGAALTTYVPEDVIALWGGQNLETQMKRFLEIFAAGDKMVMPIMEKILQSYTQVYFGTEISLYRDILPIFSQEYLFVIEENETDYILKVVVELGDSFDGRESIHNIANNFARVGAVFEPTIISHVLPDGTNAQEIVAIPEEMRRNESDYRGVTIHEIEIGGRDQGIFYAFFEDKAVISSNIDGIKSTIDIINGERESLQSAEKYTVFIEPILKNSDEITYLNFEKLLPVIFQKSSIPNFLKPITSLSSGRNYFNDGIVTIDYLEIN